MAGREVSRSQGPLRLALWCSPYGGVEERGGGEVQLRGLGGIPFLSEEAEDHAVLPLGTGHADVELRNPGSSDAAVGGPYKSDCHFTIHVPAGT